MINPAHAPSNTLPSSATERQAMAADAHASVWVDASAGTGKTKVLVDRVLRLLLPRHDGQAATPPNRILCVTFTNAAAAEMIARIQAVSQSWLVMDDATLTSSLTDLLAMPPSALQMTAARQLFATIVDTPGGLKVTTLHAFSQSILRRFPVEAGLSPALQLADEGLSQTLLEQARNTVFKMANPAMQARIQRLLHRTDAKRLTDAVAAVLKERRWLTQFFAAHDMDDSIISALYTGWKIAAPVNTDQFWSTLYHQRPLLRLLYDSLSRQTGARPLALASKVDQLLALPDTEWDDARTLYIDAFLTQEGTINSNNIKDVEKAAPDLLNDYLTAGDVLRSMINADAVRDMAQITTDLMSLSAHILQTYQHIKHQRNILDFEDQILTTRALLESNATWVMYKLDQGIDHILVDEAQDTNPDQWGIITALALEFFNGTSARSDITRTLFTVGDEKQAIYGFQRANPDDFGRARQMFATTLQQAGQDLRQIPLDTSFRSGPAVLQFVDRLMNQDLVRSGLISTPGRITHTPHRKGAGGRVAVWPAFYNAEGADGISGMAGLTGHITRTLRDWLDTGRPLVSKGRAVQPSDILILLRKRGRLQTMLVRSLRQAGIPVNGIDRMNLTDTMVAQDLLHLAKIALQPLDDYSLAGILKSPFVGLSEEDLYTLATTREKGETLWAKLQRTPDMAPVTAWIGQCITRVTQQSAYDFFAGLLHAPCPRGRSGWYALQSRLGLDIAEIVNALLDHALTLQSTVPDVLGFITACQAKPPSIKRQMTPGQDTGVTIMTVHAAKGLQAPIVILADARGSKKGNDTGFIWPHENHLDTPLWTTGNSKAALAVQAKDSKKVRDDAESRRLLYVALTRAEDEAYITGYGGKAAKNPAPDWYTHCTAAMQSIVTEPPAAPFSVSTNDTNGTALSHPQIDTVLQAEAIVPVAIAAPTIPAWLDQKVMPETLTLPVMLRPSHIADTPEPALSPLAGQLQHRFARGIHTHTLLQHLPNCPPDTRQEAAQTYLSRYAADVPEKMRAAIAAEVLAILNNPTLIHLFGPDAQAEVPISGQMPDGQWINGQIDRLVVTPTQILVLDYKTNRPPPQDASAVPASYQRQMSVYKSLLARIYPDRPIICYLLWTDGPVFMEIQCN